MAKRLTAVLAIVVAGFVSAAYTSESLNTRHDPNGLVAHEWGTFTTVAGVDGTPVDWLPLSGPSDLPCFVERYSPRSIFKGLAPTATILTYDAAKRELPGKVRMETPVIYFYSPKAMKANVRVIFQHGVMTEWYPHGTLALPPLNKTTLKDARAGSVIGWRDVEIAPEATPSFRTEAADSHYYAARNTDAAPLRVKGQVEKFLFYRGVGGFDVPLSAVALEDGGVRIANLGRRDLRSVILFENRGGKIGYRVHGTLRGEATIAAPPLTARVESLRGELERVLTEAGLYPKEARAMVETWRDSWFEEGTRVFYVLPASSVDAILPLSIDPAPAQIERVFVGRMEVITRAATDAVAAAIRAHDTATLERYGRFLGPIADRLAASASGEEGARIHGATHAAFTAYASRGPTCPGR